MPAAGFLALCKCSLALQDGKGFLESGDFGGAPGNNFLVGLGLRDATVLDLGIVLHNRIKAGLGRLPVGSKICDCFVQSDKLLSLILYILGLCGLCDLVFLPM